MNKFRHERVRQRLSTRFIKYFFRGLLISIPLVATAAIIIYTYAIITATYTATTAKTATTATTATTAATISDAHSCNPDQSSY